MRYQNLRRIDGTDMRKKWSRSDSLFYYPDIHKSTFHHVAIGEGSLIFL